VLQPSKTSYALADIEAVPHCAAASQEHVDSANNRCYTSWVSVTECDEPIPDTTNRNRISMFRAIMRSFFASLLPTLTMFVPSAFPDFIEGYNSIAQENGHEAQQ
jgi:hypothetical protein